MSFASGRWIYLPFPPSSRMLHIYSLEGFTPVGEVVDMVYLN